MTPEIANLNDLLKNHISGRVIAQNTSRLTAPGENFGSLMLKVDVTVETNGKQEILHTVAKCVPPNKEIQKIFNTETTFKSEIGWYKEIIPTLLDFQKEQGVTPVADFFMKIYDARYSLDPSSEEVDEGGVILCENLAVKGYKNVDRRIGFNLDQGREIIKKLATFHAIPLALKLQKPVSFNQKIKPYLRPSISESERYKMELFQGVLQVLKEHSETSPLASRAEEAIQRIISQELTETELREPWTTAIHTDFWVNNIMLKEEEENPPKVIILDLQTCGIGSPVADLIFFLGTSLENSIAERHFDELTQFYYKELIENIKSLKAGTSLFSYEDFENELRLEAPSQFVHCLFFVVIIMAEKGAVGDATTTEFNPDVELKKMFSNITEEHKKKYVYLVKQFAKRNWI